jgi:hypothetical protein
MKRRRRACNEISLSPGRCGKFLRKTLSTHDYGRIKSCDCRQAMDARFMRLKLKVICAGYFTSMAKPLFL